jgi:hypothetical protein
MSACGIAPEPEKQNVSFADDDGDTRFVLPPGMPRYLGDIAISWPHVQRQAAEYGHSEARELAFSPRAWLTEPFAERNLGVPAQSATRPTSGS